VYYNFCDPILDQAAQEHGMTYFLTDIDVPWEKTIYEMVLTRESVFAIFKQSLLDNNKPFVILSGDKIYDSRKQSQLLRFVKAERYGIFIT
jgi:hypothetical protein